MSELIGSGYNVDAVGDHQIDNCTPFERCAIQCIENMIYFLRLIIVGGFLLWYQANPAGFRLDRYELQDTVKKLEAFRAVFTEEQAVIDGFQWDADGADWED